MSSIRLLIIPGLNNSGPEHWQTLWEARFAGCVRVAQQDWTTPRREDWVKGIEAAVAAAPEPAILIAHSLGCLAVAHWAATGTVGAIRAALLVAPPWLGRPDANPAVAASFLPEPTARLPFRSIVVASRNDPYGPIDRAQALAEAWGSEFVDVGALGHINADSGLRDWPQGQSLLRRLMLGR